MIFHLTKSTQDLEAVWWNKVMKNKLSRIKLGEFSPGQLIPSITRSRLGAISKPPPKFNSSPITYAYSLPLIQYTINYVLNNFFPQIVQSLQVCYTNALDTTVHCTGTTVNLHSYTVVPPKSGQSRDQKFCPFLGGVRYWGGQPFYKKSFCTSA
ncbi:hypothetical protein AVEN_134740-1 [Araneus ventricosus]|uniref:Uncharacterized protein n=1 Tax=Araneus ventricosus TaxID=182803 RepID=A0A4Y2XBB2_ARAVE|nr:hypothetical protein AVEN_134740-1 [Araneus ventricosus]